ncbi:MAG TPA: mannosyltransferase family protein [Candidatus Polarisedimenticolia bacterium]|jgi:hypothetical protein
MHDAAQSPGLEAREGSRVPYADLAMLLAASRAALLIVGILSTWLIPSGLAVQKGNLVYHAPAARPLEIWARWDSEWYLLIAAEGYAGPQVRSRFEGLAVPYEAEAPAGFLPLYPILIRVLSPLMGGVAAGILISNVSLWCALVLLYRLACAAGGGASAGRVAGLAACAALLVHPMSLFLSAVYAESLFLMLSLAAIDFARRGRFAAAGLAGALGAVTRPFGLLLAAPIAFEWWDQRRLTPAGDRESRPSALALLWTLAIPSALGLFMIYCWRAFGDPLAFAHRQSRWRGGLSGPWRAFTRWWESTPTAHGAHGSTLELGIAIAFILMLPFVVRRLRGSMALYAILGVVMPLCSTLWSFGRLSLTIFPAFVMIGLAWSEGRRRFPVLYAFIGATLGGLLMALFANWWWAG